MKLLDRIEERAEENIGAIISGPNITVIAHPVFPDHPLISTAEIYSFAIKDKRFQIGGEHEGPSRVTGGICHRRPPSYWELNEYGIVYGRTDLTVDEKTQHLFLDRFVQPIARLIKRAQSFYEKCQYSGSIKITAKLRVVQGRKLKYDGTKDDDMRQSFDSDIQGSSQYLPRDLVEWEKFIDAVDELAGQLLRAFNVDDPQGRRKRVEGLINVMTHIRD